MTDFILYSIKSGLCLALFYGFYQLVLAKETHVKRNRIYLLAAILFSLVLPSINFTIEHDKLAKVNQVVWEFENSIEDQLLVVDSDSSQETIFDSTFWMTLLYSLGVLTILGRLILNLVSIFKIIRANEIKKEGDLNLIYLEQALSPYSFFNYVFLNPSILSKTENKQILLHESIHSKQLHSIDLLIIELLKAIFWFNPIIYLLKNALVEVHEYCADQACVIDDTNKIGYQQCLLQHIESKMNFNLTSAFKSSLTLKRIKMIKKSNTSVWAHLKLILIFPVLIVSMLSFDYSEIKADDSETNVSTSKAIFSSPIKPAEKVWISSPYGYRMHPIKKKKLYHAAVDIAAPKGTPIYAIADGLVKKLQANHVEGKAYGRFIIIQHEGNIASLYSQMDAYSVELGEKVHKGDVIGFVGTSGVSTGPHLHFEIKKNGENINPADLIDFTSLKRK
ncbi:M23/M56 family metallopeptidase [Ancylomarina sp.]|uniref:M23/M56 family metallopeptidase n=1 Tax=Ancylomarina sp. TaxID=1970196 RepID=UPI003569D859